MILRFLVKQSKRRIKGIRKAGKRCATKCYISPRYLANIENKGQHPSVQIFFELMLHYDISVDQFLFSEKEAEKSTQRRQLDALLDSMDKKDLTIIIATAKGIQEAKGTDD